MPICVFCSVLHRTWWLFLLGPVHTTPEIFENATLFLRLGLPSTLICHSNGAFRKRSSNRRNLKTPALRFSAGEKILKTELFENGDVTILLWFPYPSFPQTEITNDRWLLRCQISPTYCGRKTFDAFLDFVGVVCTGSYIEQCCSKSFEGWITLSTE